MKSKILILMVLCVALVVFPKLSYPAERATEQDAMQMVEMAGKMIEMMGDTALAAISDLSGRCCDKERDLYVFVYSDDVVMLANSLRHDVIGVSFKSNDPIVYNYQVSELLVKKAMKEGNGWVEHAYMNSGSGQINMKHTYAKLFRNADKNYIVCSGVWYGLPTDFVPQSESEYLY
jgi:hypothetical protein